MPRGCKLMLSFVDWPAEDQTVGRRRSNRATGLMKAAAALTLLHQPVEARRESYGQFLAFISATHQNLFALPPEARIDRSIVAEYVCWRRRSCGEMAIAIDLDHLRGALKLILPRHRLVLVVDHHQAHRCHCATQSRKISSCDQRSALSARDRTHGSCRCRCRCRGTLRKAHAFQYRDGLIIAFLALIPLRSRTLSALRIGQHLVKAG